MKEAFRRCRFFFSPCMNYVWVHCDCLDSIFYFEIIHLIPAGNFCSVVCLWVVLRISTQAAADFQVGVEKPHLPPEIRGEDGNRRLWFPFLALSPPPFSSFFFLFPSSLPLSFPLLLPFSPPSCHFYSVLAFKIICVMLPWVSFLMTEWE